MKKLNFDFMKSKTVKIVAIILAIVVIIAANISIAYAFFFEPSMKEAAERTNVQQDLSMATDIANVVNIKLMDQASRALFLGEYDCERSVMITFTPNEDTGKYVVADGIVNFSTRNATSIVQYDDLYQCMVESIGEYFEVHSNRYRGSDCIVIIDVVPSNESRPIYVSTTYEVDK